MGSSFLDSGAFSYAQPPVHNGVQRNSTRMIPQSIPPAHTKGSQAKTLDSVVRRWGIIFTGDNMSVENFLARLEEGRAVS